MTTLPVLALGGCRSSGGRHTWLILLSAIGLFPLRADLPREPMEIGHEPQFIFDNHVVDNHWAIRYKRQAVNRVFHPAHKHPGNPVLTGDQPSNLWVVRDELAGLFRMYYQANLPVAKAGSDPDQERLPETKGGAFQTTIAYAESRDGIQWTRPDLGLVDWYLKKPNNLVIGRSGQPDFEAGSPCILEVPASDLRGNRWLMLYRAKGRGGRAINGLRLVGSKDGVHWDLENDQLIAKMASDTHNTISYDPLRKEYVMFCRAKHLYRVWGEEMIDTGESRRVARFGSAALWTDWMAGDNRPQNILIPDETDNETYFSWFYGMPTRYFAGIYWGFAQPFRMNDYLYSELVVSRDGFNFQRLPGREKLVDYGPEGSWDDEMILAAPWVEVGDEWWIYYNGWDGPHGTSERTGAIGLAKVRKEGFVSMRGPSGGGVVCTRMIRWPGGDLLVNAQATQGELTVRISDGNRKPLEGFNHGDCMAFTGDSLAHPVTWNGGSIRDLKGQVIRLEFFLRDADLYTFRASGE